MLNHVCGGRPATEGFSDEGNDGRMGEGAPATTMGEGAPATSKGEGAAPLSVPSVASQANSRIMTKVTLIVQSITVEYDLCRGRVVVDVELGVPCDITRRLDLFGQLGLSAKGQRRSV